MDAPLHFDPEGASIDELDINQFIGKARLIDVSHCKRIGANELKDVDFLGADHILLRTSAHPDPDRFPEEIPSLVPDLAPFLQEHGIHLVGVDVPSVDPLDSKEMAAHHALNRHGIAILENLVLDHLGPGDYELIALPLPIRGADGSPVRAIVKPIDLEG